MQQGTQPLSLGGQPRSYITPPEKQLNFSIWGCHILAFLMIILYDIQDFPEIQFPQYRGTLL